MEAHAVARPPAGGVGLGRARCGRPDVRFGTGARRAGALPQVPNRNPLAGIGNDGVAGSRAPHDNGPSDPGLRSRRIRAIVAPRTLLWVPGRSPSRRIEPTREFKNLPAHARAKEPGPGCRDRTQLAGGRHFLPSERGAGPPRVAFFGVSRGRCPMDVSVVPTSGRAVASGHIVVASCPAELADMLPVVFPAFEAVGDDKEALLSASALDMVEQVTVPLLGTRERRRLIRGTAPAA